MLRETHRYRSVVHTLCPLGVRTRQYLGILIIFFLPWEFEDAEVATVIGEKAVGPVSR